MNFPDMHFNKKINNTNKYFEAWLISKQQTEYVFVSSDSNISHSLNIISNCVSLREYHKNPKREAQNPCEKVVRFAGALNRRVLNWKRIRINNHQHSSVLLTYIHAHRCSRVLTLSHLLPWPGPGRVGCSDLRIPVSLPTSTYGALCYKSPKIKVLCVRLVAV